MTTVPDRVCAWLKQKYQVECPRDWLEACIEWVQSENQGRNLSHNELCTHVLDQWLLSDLSEIGASCLPEDCVQQAKLTLPGCHCLQVNSVIDVSTPYYSQLQKVEGTENANTHVSATQQSQTQDPKSSRMLMFDMTDGVQKVKAMEYQPLPGINISMVPGTKVVIQGPVVCRRGVLMLTKKNITVLGGEVESLVPTNTQVKLLQKVLAEQGGDNPYRPNLPKQKFNSKHQRKEPKPEPQQEAFQARLLPRSQRNQQQHNSAGFDPDFPDDIDTETLAAMEQQWDDADMDYDQIMNTVEQEAPQQSSVSVSLNSREQPNCSRGSAHQKRPMKPSSMFDPKSAVPKTVTPIVIKPETNLQRSAPSDDFPGDMTDNDLLMCDADFTHQARGGQQEHDKMQWQNSGYQHGASTSQQKGFLRSKPSESSCSRAPEVLPGYQDSTNFDDEDDEFMQLAVQDEPKAPTKLELDLHTAPYTYLSLLLKCLPLGSVQVIKVKAYVATLLTRLEHNDGKFWSLKVKLNDGSATMDVMLGNQVLATLIGFTAQRCHIMKTQAKTNKAFRQQLAMGIKDCQQKLVRMSCIVELEVHPESDCPTVVGYHTLTAKDIEALQNRNT